MAFTTAPQVNSFKQDYIPFDKTEVNYAFENQTNTISNTYSYPNAVNFIEEQDADGRKGLRARQPFKVNNFGHTLPGGILCSQVVNVIPINDPSLTFIYVVQQSVSSYEVYRFLQSGGHFLITSFTTSPQFCFFNYISGQLGVFITADTSYGIFNISTNTYTTGTDLDYPGSITEPVFLDNYIFVCKTNTNDIYQSDFDNPLTWTPGNFITAGLDAGITVGLTKLNNNLVVLKSTGIEFFYNAGNPSGSVLAQNESFYRKIGVRHSTRLPVCVFQDTLYFVGDAAEYPLGIYALTASGIDLIYRPTLAWKLRSVRPSSSIAELLLDMRLSVGYLNNIPHLLVSNIYDDTSQTDTPFINLTTKSMVLIKFSDNNRLRFTFTFNYFNYSTTVFVDTSTTRVDLGSWLFTDALNPLTNWLDYNGNNIPYTIFTGMVNHNTTNLKTCHKINLDIFGYNGSFPSVTVSWSNRGDASSFTAPLSFSTYNEANLQAPRSQMFITRLGKYMQRAYRFDFIAPNEGFKIYGANFHIDVGTH